MVVLILAGVVGWVVVPNVIEGRVKDETRLVEESDIYEKWMDIPIPLYLNAYFFEITNVEVSREDFCIILVFNWVKFN